MFSVLFSVRSHTVLVFTLQIVGFYNLLILTRFYLDNGFYSSIVPGTFNPQTQLFRYVSLEILQINTFPSHVSHPVYCSRLSTGLASQLESEYVRTCDHILSLKFFGIMENNLNL